MRFLFLSKVLACVAILGAALLPAVARAQTTDRAEQKKQMAEVVDTKKFKKPGPYTIGVAAGYMPSPESPAKRMITWERVWTGLPAVVLVIRNLLAPGCVLSGPCARC